MIRHVFAATLPLLLILLGMLICSLTWAGPARAAEVTPAMVCQVQDAIRYRDRAWKPATCERVASALNATSDPVTMLAIAINESDLRPTAIDVVRADVYDVGLAGIRCVIVNGKCSNGPAKGRTLAELMNPETNIAVAAQIIEQKRATHGRAYLRGYNGGTRESGYGERVNAIAAALGGVRVPAKGKRMRKLVEQILRAVTPRGNS